MNFLNAVCPDVKRPALNYTAGGKEAEVTNRFRPELLRPPHTVTKQPVRVREGESPSAY